MCKMSAKCLKQERKTCDAFQQARLMSLHVSLKPACMRENNQQAMHWDIYYASLKSFNTSSYLAKAWNQFKRTACPLVVKQWSCCLSSPTYAIFLSQ